MKKFSFSISKCLLALLAAGISQTTLMAQEGAQQKADQAQKTTASDKEEAAPLHLKNKPADYRATEKDLSDDSRESNPRGEEAVIETSHPYLLPRLFTIPTAYSLQSYEVRFAGQGNIHSTLANMGTEEIKGSAAIGLGGIMELGYQLDEYYTVENISDKILMGYFKLSLLNETRFLPAISISASKNLRNSFHGPDSLGYLMDQDMYEVVFSKAFKFGDNLVTFHPGAQIIRDKVKSVNGTATEDGRYTATKVNPRLGISWQSRPKTLFMYELKFLHPTEESMLAASGIHTDLAMENNLGIRYYIRNWLCIDSGIRHYFDLQSHADEMKLHANFVGVIPLAALYDRVENYLKK